MNSSAFEVVWQAVAIPRALTGMVDNMIGMFLS